MVILVTGATGTQGGEVARALLGRGRPVRALVRDANAPAAIRLAHAGAELAIGSFEDAGSLLRAMAGVDALFSVQMAAGNDADIEREHARALIAAATASGVRHVVHSSVSNTGEFRQMPGWADGLWDRNYWESKEAAELIVRDAALPVYTILRPAFMMDNFASPKAAWMFPDLACGEIRTAVRDDTPIVLVAAEDIGQAAVAAIEDPDRFGGAAIELAGDLQTLPQIAATLSRVMGKPVTAHTCGADQLIAAGQHTGWVRMQEWMNVANYSARPNIMERWGLLPTRFAQWAARHSALIPVF